MLKCTIFLLALEKKTNAFGLEGLVLGTSHPLIHAPGHISSIHKALTPPIFGLVCCAWRMLRSCRGLTTGK